MAECPFCSAYVIGFLVLVIIFFIFKSSSPKAAVSAYVKLLFCFNNKYTSVFSHQKQSFKTAQNLKDQTKKEAVEVETKALHKLREEQSISEEKDKIKKMESEQTLLGSELTISRQVKYGNPPGNQSE